MDLISWSLSAIDTIFSHKKGAPGEPICPDGTFAAGYTRDAWNSWQVLCLGALSVEDVEDLIIFGFLIVGFLIIGLGIALNYRKISKTAAFKVTQALSGEIKEHFCDVSNRLKGLEQRDANAEELTRNISARTVDLQKQMDNIESQTRELLRSGADMNGLQQRNAQTEELIRNISAQSEDVQKRVYNTEKLTSELLRSITGLTTRMEELSRLLHETEARK